MSSFTTLTIHDLGMQPAFGRRFALFRIIKVTPLTEIVDLVQAHGFYNADRQLLRAFQSLITDYMSLRRYENRFPVAAYNGRKKVIGDIPSFIIPTLRFGELETELIDVTFCQTASDCSFLALQK